MDLFKKIKKKQIILFKNKIKFNLINFYVFNK